MRALLATAAALALASPAAASAQDYADDEYAHDPYAAETAADGTLSPHIAELTDRLGDPDEQARMAALAASLSEVLLALPVGAIAHSLEQATGEDLPATDPSATLGDMAGPDARRLPGELAERVPEMMDTMAGMAEGIEAMRPVFEEFAAVMRAQIEAATASRR